jgi:hypothetical protein
VDLAEHYFVMVGQLIDGARIGGLAVILDMGDGDAIEGVPSRTSPTVSPAEELNDTGYARRVDLAGGSIDLADVRRATIVHPAISRRRT